MKITTVIPTFNEFEELERTITALRAQKCEAVIETVVVNAGKPLPHQIAQFVEELAVQDDCFWTGSVDAGLVAVADRNSDYIMLLNADTELLENSVQRLLEVVERDPMVIACCPAYTLDDAGNIALLYSHDTMMPFFLHNYLKRDWKLPSEAPSEPYSITSIGGQGVLFRRKLIQEQRMDPQRFPHYRGDQDFWIRARKLGYTLMMVPQAGVVNNRPFGTSTMSRAQRMKKIPYLLSSPKARDSWRTIWNLHRKHQSLPIAVVAFTLYFPSMVVYRLFQLTKNRVA